MKFSRANSLFFLFFLLFISELCIAQQSKIDSLENLLKIVKDDTGRAIVLIDLSIELRYANPDLSLGKALESIEVCKKIRYKKGLAKALNVAGLSYNSLGNYSEAIIFHNKAISVFAEINDSIGIAKAFHNIGFAYSVYGETDSTLKYFQKSLDIAERNKNYSLANFNYCKICELFSERGNYPKALEYAQLSLRLSEEAGDTVSESNALNEAGLILMYQKNFEASQEYFAKALFLSEKISDKRFIATVLNNMGLLYEKKNKPDEAVKYYLKSLNIKEELMNLKSMVISYSNLARFFQSKKNYEKAIEFNKKALEVDAQLDDKQGLCIDYLQLAGIEIILKNYSNAIQLLEKARAIAEKSGYRDLQVNTYIAFADAYSKQNNYKEAYEFFTLYAQTKDSMLNESNSKQIAEMQTRYESDKKQKEIALLNKEKELQNVELAKKEAEMKRQNTQKLAFGAGFLLVLVLALVIFRGYKQKEKSNLLLSRQKQQIEIKNSHLEEANTEINKQKNEIQEKNHEILASIRYAQRIQQAILPPQKLVSSYLENYFILYQPKDIVAGDFYWVAPLNPPEGGNNNTQAGSLVLSQLPPSGGGGAILFAVCDCTGHGVPGAFVSIVGHNALNRAVKEFGLSKPSEILDKVNELVEETFSKGENSLKDGMDIAFCALKFPFHNNHEAFRENEPVKLQFAGANNELYIINPGRKEWPQNISLLKDGNGGSLKANKQPIGNFIDRKPFTNIEVELQSGDTIYAFSDGYADQFGGPKGKKFKYSQFEKLLVSIHSKPMAEQHDILFQEIEKWRGNLEQIDDICIMGVRI